MVDLHIYGPKGNPNPPPTTQVYTIIPWEEFKAEEKKATEHAKEERAEGVPEGGWHLSDKNAAICTDCLILR